MSMIFFAEKYGIYSIQSLLELEDYLRAGAAGQVLVEEAKSTQRDCRKETMH